MVSFTSKDLDQLEQGFKTTLINSISGFKSLNLIGTKSTDVLCNLAVFNSVFHVGANPPLLGFVVRPNSVDRHTLDNLLSTKYYTVNHVNSKMLRQAHQTSARYPKEVSEFEAVGLTPYYSAEFYAPFVTESNVKIGLEYQEQLLIQANNTIIIIGKIIEIMISDDVIAQDGFVAIEQLDTLTSSGLDAYYQTTLIERLQYAKPNVEPKPLK